MELLKPDAWPVWVAIAILVAAAVVNAQTGSVPNWLTLGGVVSGWAVAVIASGGVFESRGGIGSSLLATMIGFGLLFPWMLVGGLGSGCVKAQMAFGAWLGCGMDVGPAAAAAFVASLVGSFALAVVAAIAMVRRRNGYDRPRGGVPSAQVPLTAGSLVGLTLFQIWRST